MRAEIQMNTGYFLWAKNRQNTTLIDIQGLLTQYWDSAENEFKIPGQSRPPTRPPISDREAPTEAVDIGKYRGNLELRFSANTAVRIFATAHPSQLIVFHRRKLSARRSRNSKAY